MSTSQTNVDLIDDLLNLDVNSSTYASRRFRDKVWKGTQASYDAIFDEALSLPLATRFLIAAYASQLSQAEELTQHYLQAAENAGIPEAWLQAVLLDDLAFVDDSIIKAMLTFTRTLILNPIESDKAALLALEKSGVTAADCIALAQLIAFLSYQVRLVTGLKAMQALEQSI